MIQNPLYILTVLCGLIFVSEWLTKNTFLKHISGSLLVIILGAILANFGFIPSASNASPVYDSIFTYVAPASIFYLLLGVNLKELRKAGLPMLITFVLGSVGTTLGVLLASQVIDYQAVFGENYQAIAGMMTGTYTGGSANFNAVALHYDVVREGAVYTGIVVADNIVTAIWMLVTLSLPALMMKLRPHKELKMKNGGEMNQYAEREHVGPLRLGLMLFIGLAAMMVSDLLAEQTAIPSVLILTTIALILAQIKAVQDIPGAKMLGMFAVYLFLVVVGAFCEVTALVEVGEHAVSILLFTVTIVLVHGAFLLSMALMLKFDWSMVAIASQANIGGASTALALAKSFKRNDLLLPAILAGSLGTGLGTYLGFLIAGLV
ncbi:MULTISPECIES: DUF819 family protein [Roseivirga]|uniref:DUF819 domain-containing protein n=1 Tax=Roseivirga spongicola TaxID=333140 RepID=A0A150XAZ4_9BACT|nr:MULTISPECIES: DUF819 family protein [Roseivirga]KYG75844.1 hypothetical protein AWW68_08425 [Roseivirga spongicola]MBO6497207.1 DUF819 family protein [Roseivirga sp.]MBO6662802.1 DUF819 family protein [Roseivirga sp.]MBO6760721.1 DUF819 family protein [Roseivirga sp.]MBO6909820.1 DUF819 family protein [Roseivirga sp.]